LLSSSVFGFWIKLWLVSFNVTNSIPGYSFKVSTIMTNLYLYSQGYRPGNIQKVSIIFTTEEQGTVRFYSGDDIFSSMGAKRVGNEVKFYIQYSQEAFREMQTETNMVNRDLYAYLCLAFDQDKPGRDVCYQKADSYMERLSRFLPFEIVSANKKFSLKLVKDVLAGCSGTIPCGGWVSKKYCSGDNTFECSTNNDCAYVGGTCSVTKTVCDTSLNNLSCSGVNQSVCNTSGVNQCYISCNNSSETFCTWYDSPAPTPTPSPPPPPPPSGITMQVVVGLDKNRNGVFDDGYYQVIEDPGDVNCGTFPNISGLAINYSGAATGSINYHTNCAGGAYNYPYSAQGISASGNFTFALANLPSNYTLKWIEEGTGKCTLSGGTVTCTGLVSGQTYGLWFFLQEAPTCTVQGYKVVMPGNQNIAPANSQTVTLNDPLTSTSTQPYFLFYQSASKTRTVSVSVPANYTVGYTLCYNNTACHTSAPVMSSSVNLPDNSFCGSSNGYADLWWHYYPPPSCTISFNSPNYSMSVGGSQTAGTNVTFSNGTISSVNFASSNTGIATVNPASDTTSSYTTNITGVSGGSATVTANVIMSGVSRCSATTAVSVTSNPWWQVKDSDVATNQDLRSTIPPGQLFGKNGDGGYPGVAVYGTSTNLTKPNVSATGWLVNTTYSTSKIYDSNYFVNSIPGDAVINPVSSSSVAGSFFASGGTAYNGYYWYVYDGSAMGGIPLTISSAANLGARKIILIVKGANLSIKGNIKLTKGSGFFLAVAGENTAGSYGNIIVDPGVGGGGSANLEGIYVADGTFSSGTGGTSQLWVRGTVAAYGGMNLQRDLGSATNTTTPAEYFEYAPDQELLFPVDLAYSLTTWREVAP